jgi:glutathione synthase/RimK-type ligase-like ATP-grasp enzyme
MAVLILGDASDEHASHMARRLEARGADVAFLNSGDFPQRVQISLDPAGGGEIVWPDRGLRFDEIQSVYWRSYHGVLPPELPDEEQSFIAAHDSLGLFDSLLRLLPCRWVNGWEGYQLHQAKPAALARVAKLGVPVPATVVGNHPASILEFAARHPRSIFKPVQGGAHAERLTREHLGEEALARLTVSPVTVQEETPGVDVRVFVAGQRVLACEVRTEVLDFRNDPNPEIVAIDLPGEIAERSRAIAGALHLLWTGIDYRRTPAGEYFFLEANPSPMFMGFESRCGLPLTEALVDLLVGRHSAK